MATKSIKKTPTHFMRHPSGNIWLFAHASTAKPADLEKAIGAPYPGLFDFVVTSVVSPQGFNRYYASQNLVEVPLITVDSISVAPNPLEVKVQTPLTQILSQSKPTVEAVPRELASRLDSSLSSYLKTFMKG